MRPNVIATCGNALAAALLAILLSAPALAQTTYGQGDANGTAKAGPAKADLNPVPVCATCHEDKHTSIVMTAHGARNDAQGSMCQACHGDASDHLKDPSKFKPANLVKYGTAQQKAEVCLACHKTNRELQFWESGKHALNEVPCETCHDIHGAGDHPPRIAPYTTTFRPNQADLCGTCHQDKRAEILKPSHHPIIEGKIKCSNCHNPHGAISPVMLRNATVNDQCVSCHTDKRGPYVFEHPPVEDNCATCHNPHGSAHYDLLNERPPNLCQDCHDTARHPGTIYGGGAGWLMPNGKPNPSVNTRFIAGACVNCHASIHGSDAPGAKGMYFLR